MRFKWGFDEDEEQCRRMKPGLLQQIVIVIMPTIWQIESGTDKSDTNRRKMRPTVGRIWELTLISRSDPRIQRH